MSVRLPRRSVLKIAGASAAFAIGCGNKSQPSAAGDAGATSSAGGIWPGKASDLVTLTERPPNLEMPMKYLATDLTPNEAMFVRWHLSALPTSIDERTYRLKVNGEVDHPLELSLDDVKKMPPVSIVAVNQCSGNSRSASSPRVPGVQWSNGAMGNAKWTGVRLKDLLDKAGVKAGAVDVSFGGLDRPPMPTVADFVKSLDVARAADVTTDVIIAWAMNDAPLPMLNGFPLRLIVPGFYSTYWVKALDAITVLPQAFDGYWMAKAYRVPKNEDANESPDDLAKETVPITKMNVRSFFAKPLGGEKVARGQPFAVEGVAFDGGSGIAKVELSTDGGATFADADLGDDYGKYAWRRWKTTWTPTDAGKATLVIRATSVAGETQRTTPRWNRAGYMKNDPERVEVTVT
jgi:DMSO/TMAO reductase YedYZ molybdopterin-dependent catalytic subunit